MRTIQSESAPGDPPGMLHKVAEDQAGYASTTLVATPTLIPKNAGPTASTCACSPRLSGRAPRTHRAKGRRRTSSPNVAPLPLRDFPTRPD